MRFTLISAKKDLTRLGRDPLALVTALGIPLVLIALITLVFGGRGNATPQGKLLVADEDQTFVSRTIRGAFGNESVSKMITVEGVEREEGLRRMNRGEASALLIVPRGFQNAYLRNQPVELQLVENPAQRILPKIIEETLSIVMDGGFYLQKLAPVPLSGFAGAPPLSDEGAAFLGIRFNRLTRDLRKYLNPPLIDLKFNVAAENPENRNVAALFLPAMLFMSLLFLANAHALDIWKEQAWGTMRRLAATPVSLAALLGGRLISLVVVLSGVALVGVAGMRWFAGVPVASVGFAAVWLVLSGSAFYLLLVTIAVRSSNQRTANVTGNLVVFPLALIGGCFFPFEMMPDWMASIGRLTPNGWAITQFKALVAGSAGAGHFFVGVAYITGAGAILYLAALRGIRKLV
jgi:ABC-type Na+ efflux pump permease subunit